eukprot:11182953-Lingulodinium_polyedra.AAC.1
MLHCDLAASRALSRCCVVEARGLGLRFRARHWTRRVQGRVRALRLGRGRLWDAALFGTRQDQ